MKQIALLRLLLFALLLVGFFSILTVFLPAPDVSVSQGIPVLPKADTNPPVPEDTQASRQVLYTFDEGSGTIIMDRSNVGTPLNLTISDASATEWLPGALAIRAPVLISSQEAASELILSLQATGEMTMEAWVTPASANQSGPARIVSLSQDPYHRNITLGQETTEDAQASFFDVRLRTTSTSINGTPSLSGFSLTPADTPEPALVHIVYTYDATGVARLYVDTEEQASAMIGGDLSNWNADYPLLLANELTRERPWLGELHRVAIYNRALNPDQVAQNFQAGPDGGASVAANPTATPQAPSAAVPGPSATPEPTPTPTPDPQVPANYFPLGMFEDATMVLVDETDEQPFRRMINDLKPRGFDTVILANNWLERDNFLFEISDELGFQVFAMPARELDRQWWPPEVPADEEIARQLAEDVVRSFGRHPSIKGYIVKDEPDISEREKVALMTRALEAADSTRLATPILIGINRVGPIFESAQPGLMLINVYPVGKNNPIGDFTLTGLGYNDIGFVDYIRLVTENKPDDIPLWIILQAHRYDGGPFSLREPVPAELRAQNWLAIGEGATGIFWFVYSTQQSWIGLADNPPLLEETTDLARRVGKIRHILLDLEKTRDVFEVEAEGNAYISTLTSHDGARQYAVAVNRDCEQPQALTIGTTAQGNRLRDLETGEVYEIGTPITFRPGDGKVFELFQE